VPISQLLFLYVSYTIHICLLWVVLQECIHKAQEESTVYTVCSKISFCIGNWHDMFEMWAA